MPNGNRDPKTGEPYQTSRVERFEMPNDPRRTIEEVREAEQQQQGRS